MDENVVRSTGVEMAALRKLIFRMAEVDDPEETTLIEAANRAAENYEELTETVAEVEQVAQADLDRMEYDQLTKQDKVRIIQSHLVEAADSNRRGTSSLNYREVRVLFDGRPSPGHAYDLMELAGDERGFNYEQNGDEKNNRVTVNLDAVNNEAAFHGVNKATS
jgi:hypothetical protein